MSNSDDRVKQVIGNLWQSNKDLLNRFEIAPEAGPAFRKAVEEWIEWQDAATKQQQIEEACDYIVAASGLAMAIGIETLDTVMRAYDTVLYWSYSIERAFPSVAASIAHVAFKTSLISIDEFETAAQKVVEKNAAKTKKTHVVMNGMVTRRDKITGR